VILNVFGYTDVENFDGNIEKMFFLKTKNENTLFNFVKKNPENCEINDLILYKSPLILDTKFAKKKTMLGRLIAKPGDEIKIDKSQVFVNKERLYSGDQLKFIYRISMSDATNFAIIFQNHDVIIKNIINDRACDFIATQQTADSIQNEEKIVNLRKIVTNKEIYSYDFFPFNPLYFWDTDNLGPVVIPKKGETITLNDRNYYLYRRLINDYEDNILIFELSRFHINDEETNQYTFKKNYYFVLTDNRYKTNDSREFGFIPEDQILGTIF
jgi:signal peptidase I